MIGLNKGNAGALRSLLRRMSLMAVLASSVLAMGLQASQAQAPSGEAGGAPPSAQTTPVPAPPAQTPLPETVPPAGGQAQTEPTPAETKPAETKPATPEAPGQESATVVTVELTSRPTLVVRGKAKWDDGFEAITGAFGKLREEAKRLGATAGGKPVTIFIESDDENFTFDAMLPLSAEPAGKQPGEGFTFGKTPGGKAMKFEHRGAYAEIEVTYEAITAYLDEKGLLAEDAFIEEYLNEPKSAEDTDLEVDIYVFLKTTPN